MSIAFTHNQIDESQGEISANSTSYERKYRVIASDTAEEIDVVDYMNAQVARRVGWAFCDSIQAEAQTGSRNRVWTVTVRWRKEYKKREEPDYPKQDLGLYEESFQTQEERRKISFCRSESVYTRSGYTGTGFYNRIGVNGEGAEVSCENYGFNLQRRFDYTLVNSTLRDMWLNLYGCINSEPFRGFGAGIVRFTGFSGRSVVEYDGSLVTIDGETFQAAQAYYDVTFTFQCKPIEASREIGGITCTNVSGWAYPWDETIKVDDANTGRTVDMPIAVHVAQVYRTADLNALLS